MKVARHSSYPLCKGEVEIVCLASMTAAAKDDMDILESQSDNLFVPLACLVTVVPWLLWPSLLPWVTSGEHKDLQCGASTGRIYWANGEYLLLPIRLFRNWRQFVMPYDNFQQLLDVWCLLAVFCRWLSCVGPINWHLLLNNIVFWRNGFNYCQLFPIHENVKAIARTLMMIYW